MDTVKMGKFLKELRREQNMTQEALGERIGVTNKTVSRWETGAYVPPVDCLMLMSDIYGVTINEMVAGQRLDEKDYAETADENLTELLKESEAQKDKFENRMIGLMMLTTALGIMAMILLPSGSSMSDNIRLIIVVLLVLLLMVISTTLCVAIFALKRKERIHNKSR